MGCKNSKDAGPPRLDSTGTMQPNPTDTSTPSPARRRRLSTVTSGSSPQQTDPGYPVADSPINNHVRPNERRLLVPGAGGKLVEGGSVPLRATDLAGPLKGIQASAGPLRYGFCSRAGDDPHKSKGENQDTYLVSEGLNGSSTQMLIGVMDGHGPSGGRVSRFVRDRLPELLETPRLETNPRLALKSACLEAQAQLRASKIDVSLSGTTLVFSLLTKHRLITANVGDSRAVLGRMTADGTMQVVELSHDHKPDLPDERARVEKRGGRVTTYEYGVPRVWLRDMSAPGLAMSRSLGDQVAHSVGVVAEPDFEQLTLQAHDKLIIWASDGVWEFISSAEAVEVAFQYRGVSPQRACEALVALSVERWKEEEDVIDDITVVVAFVDILPEAPKSTLTVVVDNPAANRRLNSPRHHQPATPSPLRKVVQVAHSDVHVELDGDGAGAGAGAGAATSAP